MIQTSSTVMQLLEGSYLSVAAYRERHNVRELCFTWFKVKYKKSYISKVYKWNISNWYLDIDFNLEVCGEIVFLEVWTKADFLKLYRGKWIP